MSESSDGGWSLYSFWLLCFVIIKLGGTALAAWSWLWVFVPIVPVLVVFLTKLGVL